MKEVGTIYLSWRKGQGANRHLVGVIKRNATEGVRFFYLQENLTSAKADGFQPYQEFSDLNKEYRENILEIFGQRLMKSERSDLKDFYSFWEIREIFKEDKFYMLAFTQGLSPSDNFEFLAEFNPTDDLVFVSDLAGLSNLNLPSGTLEIGQKLDFKLDAHNIHDRSAVAIFANDNKVGYIKKVHNKVFHKLKSGAADLTVKAIEQNGVIRKVFVRVSIFR